MGAEDRSCPSVLFVCTGNLCRSPIAAALLASRAAGRGVALTISSAGFGAEGVESPRRARRAMRRRGIDLSMHRSRKVTGEMVDAADLVIGFTRQHAWDSSVLGTDAVPRIFPLLELVTLDNALHGRRNGESFADWLTRVHEARRVSAGSIEYAGIEDPFGRSLHVYKRVARQIDRALSDLQPSLFGSRPEPPVPWASGSGDADRL
jgi:protein-tyrosine phosphatase